MCNGDQLVRTNDRKEEREIRNDIIIILPKFHCHYSPPNLLELCLFVKTESDWEIVCSTLNEA